MKYSISIVSHQSGRHLQNLLHDLRKFLPANAEVILTINVPEDEGYLKDAYDLPVKVIRNNRAYGFGENHNRAFEHALGRYFIIVNPDIRLTDSPFETLCEAFNVGTGACAPMVLSPQKTMEDSARRFPTVVGLLKRVIMKHRSADYDLSDGRVQDIDWAAGMFVMFDADVFRKIGGFDTRYFMYMEDVDVCWRLWAHGFKVHAVPQAQVVHDAQRASRRSWQHMRWHIRSSIRFIIAY